RRADGKALHVRKATRAEPEQMAIYRALKVNPAPGGISKTIVYKTENRLYFSGCSATRIFFRIQDIVF
ncbi:MAG: hypothetical protein WC856_28070, partial [Methylococcaceae bacterium]